MRRLAAALTCLALLGLPTASSSASVPRWHSWSGTPTDVFRTGQYSAGEYIFTNGLRQARGANTDRLERSDYYAGVKASPTDPTSISKDLYNAFTYDFFGAHRAAHNGDYQLPDSLPAGTGEVAELRLAIDGPELFVRFHWNSFPGPDTQIATLTFGSGPTTIWPHGAHLAGAHDIALTVWGTGGAVTRGAHDTAITVRSGDHTTEARVPLALLPAGPWTLRGGSGLADPADPSRYQAVAPGPATSTAPGSGGPTSPTNVWGLLFAGDNPWSFDELAQSRQLTVGVDTALTTVDPSLLQSHSTRLAPIKKGSFSRLLHSAYGTADGISKDRSGAGGTPPLAPPIPVPDLNVSYFYNGALQDYAMQVPASYDGSSPRPLVVYLHGYTGLPEEAFRNPTGLVKAIEEKGWLLAAPLGRGDYFYRGGTPGEADVLEVMADVAKRYRVDPDRIYLMGHSMGGYGTNNLATHHPDLFAAVAPAEGTDSQDLFANLRNTPWFEMTAEEDLDTGGAQAKALYASLSGAGYDATLIDYRLKTHEYSSIYDTLPRLLRFFDSHRRPARPAAISWTRPVGQDNARLQQNYDGAWWLRDVEAAPGVTRPTITVESMALPHRTLDPNGAQRTAGVVDEGGPTGRTTAQLFQTVPAAAVAPLNPDVLRLTASGVRSATVRLSDAGLLRRSRLVIPATTDHDVQLRLEGVSGDLVQSVDGIQTGVLHASGGALTALVPAGPHTVVLSRGPATVSVVGAAAAPLPATGGLPWAAAGLALLVGVSLLRRRSLRF